MMILITLLLFALALILSQQKNALTYLGRNLHDFCLRHAPESQWLDYYNATVCGSSLPTDGRYNELIQLGIIHIMVVSGSHLGFLLTLLRVYKVKKQIRGLELFSLFIFVLNCNLQMPVVRAWVHWMLSYGNEKWRLQYQPLLITLLSVVFCVGWHPNSINSFSLLLSWLATLSIQISRTPLQQSILCYFLLIPVLLHLQLTHPITILINMLYAPLVGFILFPASLITYVIGPLSHWVDKIWELFWVMNQALLTFTPQLIQPTAKIDKEFLWLWALCVNFFAIHWQRIKRL